MIYNTDNQEIITLYKIYGDLKQFINELSQAKKYLFDNNVIRQTKSYCIRTEDKATYKNFRKVYKIVFDEMLNRDKLNEILTIYQILNNKYFFSLINGKLYERPHQKALISKKQFEINNDIYIFEGHLFTNFKQLLKNLIKFKLDNKPIDPLYTNYF